MASFRARRPSAALVISVIALIAALSGTAYAAVLGANSVGTKQLKKNAVTNRKINNGAVGNAKLKNGSVSTNKLQNGAVTASKLNTTGLTVPNTLHANSADSATNATNATHATSATSATSALTASTAGSAAALTGVNFVQNANVPNPATTQTFAQVDCPAGQYVTGGGAFGAGGTLQSINSSFPFRSSTNPLPNSWGTWMNNTSATASTFTVYAICASGSGTSSFTANARKH